jgi:hypothetical protein
MDIDSLATVASAFMRAGGSACRGSDDCDGGCTIGSSPMCSQLKFNICLIAMAAEMDCSPTLSQLSDAPPQPMHTVSAVITRVQ